MENISLFGESLGCVQNYPRFEFCGQKEDEIPDSDIHRLYYIIIPFLSSFY